MLTLAIIVPGGRRVPRGKNEPQGACSGSECLTIVSTPSFIEIPDCPGFLL